MKTLVVILSFTIKAISLAQSYYVLLPGVAWPVWIEETMDGSGEVKAVKNGLIWTRAIHRNIWARAATKGHVSVLGPDTVAVCVYARLLLPLKASKIPLGLNQYLWPCWCLRAMLPQVPSQSELPMLPSGGTVISGCGLLPRIMSGSFIHCSWVLCWCPWPMLSSKFAQILRFWAAICGHVGV